MPAGRTHDRITLWGLPWVAAFTFIFSQSGNLTLLVSGGFLFGGLMFGPDLDIRSRQFKRWGWLRWIWIPYQKSIRHRSLLSHGPVIGTLLRLVYLGAWSALWGFLGLSLVNFVWQTSWRWLDLVEMVKGSFLGYSQEWLALWAGLEVGAMSHSFSDWGSSFCQRKPRI